MQHIWTSGATGKLSMRTLAWPVLALFLLSGLWGFTLWRAARERERVLEAALAEVAAAAYAYEQYTTRSVAQMDQVSLQLKQSWEQSQGALALDDMARQGMFVNEAFACVAIVDAHGRVRTAIRRQACDAAAAHDAYLLHHRYNNTDALRIGPPAGAAAGPHQTVLFTRRLERGDGEFDGVVLVVVRASFFTSFYLPATSAVGGIVAIAGTDSPLRAEQVRVIGAAPVRSALPADMRLWSGAAGVVAMAGFPDGQPRLLGWHSSRVYSLVSLVAVPERAAMAAYESYWREARAAAAAVSILLVLAAAAASAAAMRRAARHQAREHVRLAYRTATEGANDGFYMANPIHGAGAQIVDFEIVDCNERGARFYGIGRQELIGRRLSTMDTGSGGQALFESYRRAMDTGFHEDERLMPERNRLNITWGKRRIVRVGNGLAITLQDVSERRAHVAEVARLSNEDILTGLPNRPWLMNYLPGALLQEGEGSTALTLLFINLDDFELVNELHGHAVGDAMLKAAAQRLRTLLRPADCVVRFGGDEFVVLLAPADSADRTERVAARIVEAFAAPLRVGEPLWVGVSVGAAVYPRDAADAPGLIRQAEIAMQAAKQGGKGSYRFFEPTLARSLQAHAQLKQGLLDALEQDQFVLYYQPRVDAHTGELCSMEALLRWHHPQRGMVPPLEFIALAESSGLIHRIGELVMDKACAQLAAWREQALPLVPVSVNVSPLQFARGEVHHQLALCLRRHALAPQLLEVEITESAMMGEQDDIIAQLAAIRALGVRLHVDDFGTGYSSLSQLQKLRMDVLKVDRAFTSELDRSREGRVFFQAIVSMAHALGMAVVAEGVETPEQLQILRELNCNEAQGYLIARPMPADHMAALLRRPALLGADRANGPGAAIDPPIPTKVIRFP